MRKWTYEQLAAEDSYLLNGSFSTILGPLSAVERSVTIAHQSGTLIQLLPGAESAKRLHIFLKEIGISNVIPCEDYHLALVESSRLTHRANHKKNYIVSPSETKFELWEYRSWKLLILRVLSQKLIGRRNRLMRKIGIPYDRIGGNLHLLLSKNPNIASLEKLGQIDFELTFNMECWFSEASNPDLTGR